MGRLIEESRVVEILQQTWLSGTIAHRFIDDIRRRIRIEVPTVEAIPKAQYDELKANITMMRLDYEARLKADLEAVLTELQLEIEEARRFPDDSDFDKGYNRAIDVWKEVIQEKIDSLKGENNDDR